MAEQEFVIVPPSDTDVSAMALRTDMQFLDPYGSESINRKFFGIIPPGIYRGFKYALPGGMKLRIGQPNEPGTAIVQCNSVCITVQQTKPVDLTVSAGFSGLVVLTGFYQFGVPTKQVDTTSTQDAAKIELIQAGALQPNQVVLYTVNVPAGTATLTSAMISTARRQDVSIAVDSDIYQLLQEHITSPTAHTKDQVGLSLVNNWGATAAVNDASDTKYATAGAVKKAYDLAAAALPKAGGTVGRIKIHASATHLTLAGENGENPWHFEVNSATGELKVVETGVATRFSMAKGGAATFTSSITAGQAYASAAQSEAANALTRRDFVLKWSEDNSRLDALKQAGAYHGGATKTDFNLLDVGAHGLYSSGPDGDKSLNMPPQEARGGSWVGLEAQRVFNSDMLQTTLPFADAKTVSFRTRRSGEFGEWISFYSTAFKPTQGDVGLSLVNNWGATAAVNDASDVKYATAGAVKKAYDLAAAALPKGGGAISGMLTFTGAPRSSTNQAHIFHDARGVAGEPVNIRSMREAGSATWLWEKVVNGSLRYSTGTTGAGVDKIQLNVSSGEIYLQDGTKRAFHQGFAPTSDEVGLGNVNNWPATSAVTDASDVKYATAGAVKKAYDLAAGALPSSRADVFTSSGMLTDLNSAGGTRPGHFQFGPNAVGSPLPAGYGHGLTISNGSAPGNGVWYQQLVFGHDRKIYTRRAVNAAPTAAWDRIFTTEDNPTKEDVGLPLVNNWGATAAVNDASDVKYATAGAVKKAYDLADSKLASNANAVSATKLATARQINGTNFDGTANITTANWGAARTLTVGNSGKSVNGSGDIAWSLAEIGAARAKGEVMTGTAGNITTAQFVQWLRDSGAFNERVWIARGSWSYAHNKTITDTGCGNIHLSGCTIEVISNHEGAYTVRIVTPTTTSGGGTVGAEFVYVNNGDTYAPGWRRIFSTTWAPNAADVGLGNLANFGWNYNAVGDTYAIRDSAGDINARLFRSNYQNQGDMSGALAFRVNNSNDSYTRYCSNPAAVRAWLGVPSQQRLAATQVGGQVGIWDGAATDLWLDVRGFNGMVVAPQNGYNQYIYFQWPHADCVFQIQIGNDHAIFQLYNNGRAIKRLRGWAEGGPWQSWWVMQ